MPKRDKRARELRLPAPVERVIWYDANTQQGPVPAEHFNHRCILDFVAYLVREVDGMLSYAMEYSGDDEKLWRHIVHIPKVNVISRAVLAKP